MNPDSTRPRGHELVLAIVGVAAVLAVIPVIVVAGDLDFWMPVAAVVAAAAVFARRDSGHALVALAAVALMWLASGADPASWGTLVVALLMFVTHASLALRTTAPPGAAIGRDAVLRWLARSLLAAVLTGLVYALVYAVRDLERTDAEVILAAALLLLGCLILLLRQATLADLANAQRRTPGQAFRDPDSLDSPDKRRRSRVLEGDRTTSA
jgi:hypothetical protein